MTMIMQRNSMLGSSIGGGSLSGGRMGAFSVAGGAGSLKISQASRSFSSGGGAGMGMGMGMGSGIGMGMGMGMGMGGGGGGSFMLSAGGGGGGAAGFAMGGGDDSLTTNGKFAMQNLNDRLATYLAKVAALEKANTELELKIKSFVETKVGPTTRDFSAFHITIKEMQGKIQDAILIKGNILLQIDNAKLAGDDFRMKFENELSMRQSVEADIAGLKMLLGEMSVAKTDLAMQIELLTEELVTLKKNHEEDLVAMRTQMSGQVNVEVDAAPQADLTKVLEEIREHYEGVVAKSSKDLQSWFAAKSESISQEVATTEMTIVKKSDEVKEVKSQLQSMEIELQSQISMKTAIEASLFEVQNRYAGQLSGFQMMVANMEASLVGLKADLERQGEEYRMLLDIKSRLEMEIAEYRRLLDGEGVGSAKMSIVSSSLSSGSLSSAALASAVESAATVVDSSSSSITTTTTVVTKTIEETIQS